MKPAEESPSDRHIESLMKEYTDAWNREDMDAIESYYNIPFFSYKEGSLEIYLDAD